MEGLPAGKTSNLIPIKEAAERFGVSRRTLDRLIASGHLTKYRRVADRHAYVDVEQVRALLEPRAV